MLLFSACNTKKTPENTDVLDEKFQSRKRPFNNPDPETIKSYMGKKKSDEKQEDSQDTTYKSAVPADQNIVYDAKKNSDATDAQSEQKPERTQNEQTEAHDDSAKGDTLIVPVAPKLSDAPQGGYVIQAGAFKDPKNAEDVRKQIAISGVKNVKIQSTVSDGETFYRVRVYSGKDATFDNKSEALPLVRDIASKSGQTNLIIVPE